MSDQEAVTYYGGPLDGHQVMLPAWAGVMDCDVPSPHGSSARAMYERCAELSASMGKPIFRFVPDPQPYSSNE